MFVEYNTAVTPLKQYGFEMLSSIDYQKPKDLKIPTEYRYMAYRFLSFCKCILNVLNNPYSLTMMNLFIVTANNI